MAVALAAVILTTLKKPNTMTTPATPRLVTCTKPSHAHLPYLEGPCDPWYVRNYGYKFTADKSKAWPFPSEKAAVNKARIVNAHIGWTKIGENHMATIPA
jgi:hypothetical protein